MPTGTVVPGFLLFSRLITAYSFGSLGFGNLLLLLAICVHVVFVAAIQMTSALLLHLTQHLKTFHDLQIFGTIGFLEKRGDQRLCSTFLHNFINVSLIHALCSSTVALAAAEIEGFDTFQNGLRFQSTVIFFLLLLLTGGITAAPIAR